MSTDRLALEHDNFRAALTWTIESDPETALRLAGGLPRFWDRRGLWNEGYDWLRRTLKRAPEGSPAARATALVGLAGLANQRAEFEDARRWFEEGRVLYEGVNDRANAARAIRQLGIVATNVGDQDRARDLAQQALAEFRVVGTGWDVTDALTDLGNVAYARGDNPAAITCYEEALALARSVGDDWLTGMLLGNLGCAHYRLGDMERAEALVEEELVVARRLGDTMGIAHSQGSLASHAFDRGQYGEAIERVLEALTITHELRAQAWAARSLDHLAFIAVEIGQAGMAVRLSAAAVALRAAVGDALDTTEEAERAVLYRKLRERLGKVAYAEAWEAGRAMTLDQAVATAKTIAPPPTGPAARSLPAVNRDAGLTTREVDVLRLLVEGQTDKEIAAALGFSRRAASRNVASILGKLGAPSRTAAATLALRDHLV